MQIYFTSVLTDKEMVEMVDSIQSIHNNAINNFKLNGLSEDRINQMKSYRLEVVLNTRMKSRGGFASYNRLTRKIKIEINYRLHKTNMDSIKDTYLHELGHAIEFFFFDCSDHGYRWKTITATMGGDTSRTHKMDTSELKSKRTRYNYSCGCQIHTITSVKHNRIQRGLGYKCTKCGNSLKMLTSEMKRFVPEKTGIIG
jgi:predicted SprT family Zn-dependent metalloprotease